MGLLGFTKNYKDLRMVHRRSQGVIRVYRGLQESAHGFTRNYKNLQGLQGIKSV